MNAWWKEFSAKFIARNVCYVKHYYYLCAINQSLGMMKRQLLPRHARMLSEVGNQIKLARLRRNITSVEMAQRTSLGRNTIVRIEAGDERVAMGSYFRVLIALGLDRDILLLAKDDELGRQLQDANLLTRLRATSK